MTRTRVIFMVIILLAVIIVAVGMFLASSGGGEGEIELVKPPDELEVRVLCALPVEQFVSEAAEQFNAANHELEGTPIKVKILPMDGLTAMGKFERNDFGAVGTKLPEEWTAEERAMLEEFPTVWIPDNRYLPELVNAVYKEKWGRDVFLTSGEYRAKPLATSLFAWGIYASRAQVLRDKFGEINWETIHDAAMTPGGWSELGGDPAWGYFKLVVPNPHKNVGGLAAMVAMGGEYYDKNSIDTADIGNPEFQAWLEETMGAVTDFSSLGAYSVENLALFGYSMGDGGQLLESDILSNMEGIVTRWDDPLVIVYPEYITWFDFPFTVWMGAETTALEKNAALEFEKYLLSLEVQKLAVDYGLRPANTKVSITEPDSPFVKWQDQGVMTVVPRATAMRSPNRDVLLALLRWFDLNVAK